MACSKRTHADDMDIIFHSLARRFGRSLEQWADVDIEAEVSECR